MKTRIIKTMTEEDEKIVTNLRIIGMSRKAAKVLAYLRLKGSGSALDIEIATGMSQPEVSIGLKEMGVWVAHTQVQKSDSKRPVAIYTLTSPVGDIFKVHFEKATEDWNKVVDAYGILTNDIK